MSHSRLGDTGCSHIPNDRRTAHKHKQARPEHLSQAGLHVLLKDASLLVGVVSPLRLLSHLCYREDLSLVFSLWHAESQLLPRWLVQVTDHSLRLGGPCVHLCIWAIHVVMNKGHTHIPIFFSLRCLHLPAIVYTPKTRLCETHKITSTTDKDEEWLITHQQYFCISRIIFDTFEECENSIFFFSVKSVITDFFFFGHLGAAVTSSEHNSYYILYFLS